MNEKEYLQKAVEIVGSQSALARLLDTSRQHVHLMVHSGRVPPKHCIPIERATAGRVKRYELRPDIYPPEEYRQ